MMQRLSSSTASSAQDIGFLVVNSRMHSCRAPKRRCAKVFVEQEPTHCVRNQPLHIPSAFISPPSSVIERSSRIDQLWPQRFRPRHFYRTFFSSSLFNKHRSHWLPKRKPKTAKDGTTLATVTAVPFQLDGLHYSLLAALALICFFDVSWFVRAFDPILRAYARETLRFRSLTSRTQKNLSLKDVLQKTLYRSWCTTQDLDFLLHMNNVRYLREMDFARFQHFTVTGIGHFLVEFKARTVVAASTIRYRKSVNIFEKYFIETKVLCWDATALYMEQRFVAPNGMAKAVAYYKMHVSVPDMDVNELMRRVCKCESPEPPDYIHSWMAFVSQSSEALKNERALREESEQTPDTTRKQPKK